MTKSTYISFCMQLEIHGTRPEWEPGDEVALTSHLEKKIIDHIFKMPLPNGLRWDSAGQLESEPIQSWQIDD